ncbi:MAG: ribbon-helix-helix protein, CopG family [Nanoarchaeota archaeon]|nr:ribbon-helix-helix protein, CopG family [Nanoarchaeota archaeon]
MKHVVSVSLDKETVFKIQDILRKKGFRNKSHIVEEAVRKLWEGDK